MTQPNGEAASGEAVGGLAPPHKPSEESKKLSEEAKDEANAAFKGGYLDHQ
jgi:hypothetical protein